MADIDVVPKKRTSTWLWIIAAIIVALIAWVIISSMRNTPERVGRADVMPHAFTVATATHTTVS